MDVSNTTPASSLSHSGTNPRGSKNSVRQLPHDLLAEKSLLGCLMIDGASFDEISDLKIKREDFFHPQYGIIFEAMFNLFTHHKPVDYITVSSQLAEMGKLEEIGGASSLSELVDDQVSSAHITAYAKTVRDKSSLREIIRTSMRVTTMGMNFHGSMDDFVQEVESAFFKLTNQTKSGKMVKLNTCLRENLKELEDTDRQPGEIQGLSTGYPTLDRFLLGMQAGQLLIVAARPGMGKTSLALNIATNACFQHGQPVAIFSLEMLSSELSLRLLSSKAKVDSKRLKTKNFTKEDLRSIASSIQELSELSIFINDSGDSTLLDIQSQCRKIQAEYGLGLIIVDYLQLMSPHGPGRNAPREQQIAEISRGLKGLAKELNCPIIALSQLNRAVEGRIDKRPNTADLRESGAIEQDADVVMLVYRDEFYNQETREPGVAEIIVAKNRSGETGTAKLAWVGPYTSFEKLAFGDEP